VRIEPSVGSPATGWALASGDVVARLDATGRACMSAIVAEDRGVQAIVPAGDLAHAWLFVEDRGALSARPLACAWSDEVLPATMRDLEGFYEEAFEP
jgi:hypothetical protein